MEEHTRKLWYELHTRALNYHGTYDQKFIKEWSAKIPRYTKGCKCHEHWVQWLKNHKPVFNPADEYFAWSVRAHNTVNIKLGKPTLTITQAKKLYTN